MKFDKEAAKKAGYSDQEIQQFLSKSSQPSFDSEAAKKAGYSDKEIETFIKKNQISKTQSVLSAPLKGLIKGASQVSTLADPVQSALNMFAPNNQQKILEDLTEKFLPTKNETAEQILERAGRIIPTAALGAASIPSALLQTAGGTALGQLAKEEGVGETGQDISEFVGMGIPGLVKGAAKTATSLIKKAPEKLASGLTKPTALGAKLSEKALTSPAIQEKAIAKLNEEASSLAKTTLHKELPLAKQIEQGVDFNSQFESRFGNLEKIAEKANPQIDITPVSDLMEKTFDKFKGIPELHPEAKKIKKEIISFSKRPASDLKRNLRTFRSNNKKINSIYETSRLTGKQQEYVDFLLDYNRNITKSIENTLPKDSAWMKEFKDTNKFYKEYRDTLKTIGTLEPILEQKLTPASLSKFAEDKRLQKKLSLSMGQKGADEIIQLSKDLKEATGALKKIPAREIKAWDAILPLGVFIPGYHVPGAVLSAKKYLDWARRGYGWFLSSPKRRAAYGEALKAIREGDVALYAKAAQSLQNSIGNQVIEENADKD